MYFAESISDMQFLNFNTCCLHFQGGDVRQHGPLRRWRPAATQPGGNRLESDA